MIRALARTVAVAILLVASTAAGLAQETQQMAVAPPAAERLGEVRVHGNHATPDAEVLRLAGLSIGQALTGADVEAALRRLRGSGRFADVEIRKRSRSLSDAGDVALIVLVREHPVPAEVLEATPAPLRPFRRLFASGMLLPVLQYTDGYGLTYGGRVAFVDVLGRGSRVSVPATWGGTKRVAVEAERSWARGPVRRLAVTASIRRRTNPFFDLDEDRRDVALTASRPLGPFVRVAAQAGYAQVGFGPLDERLASFGAGIALDTRQDPVFPRDAVYAEAGWTALRPSVSGRANRVRVDARGYKGLVGQSVLSLRWQYTGADAPLPSYERQLLGGAGSLRGYRAGRDSGDNLMAGTLELRVPLTSPMGISRAGFSVFADAGAVWDHGTSLGDAPVRRGGGAGVFLLASIFQLNLDVAVRQGGGGRVHLSTGLQF
jgi:outer membrane protein assembly factor BamA